MRLRSTSFERIVIHLQSVAFGGTEAHAVDLAEELAARGHEVVLSGPPVVMSEGRVQRLAEVGVELWSIDTGRQQGLAPQSRALALFGSRLARWRPQLVHLQMGRTAGCLPALATVRLSTRARVVVTEHLYPIGRSSRRMVFSARGVDWLADALIAVSRHNASIRLAELRPGIRRFASILNGIRTPPLDEAEQRANREAIRRELGIPADAVVVGTLVRLVEDKGLEVFLQAFADHVHDPKAVLLLVGDGPLRSALEQQAQAAGIAERVVFAGQQPAPVPYLDAMDVFTLPVPKGSMSIALLEAMSRRLAPIITFCGPEEAVVPGVTGLGPAPDDPESLGEAIDLLVRDADERSRLARAAEAHVRRYFSVQRMVDDVTEVYRAACGGELPSRLRADTPPQPFGGRQPLVAAAPAGGTMGSR